MKTTPAISRLPLSHLPRRSLVALGLILSACAAAILWAFFWQDENCSQPGCARQRYSLLVELDSFEQVAPIPLEVTTREGVVSVESVLESGGVSVKIERDQTNLPFAAASGKLDRADLYQFAKVWRSSQAAQDADARLYAMLAPSIVSDTGEDLFGLMFDSADREGFAVAPMEIAKRFQAHEPEAIALLQVRTFIHELLHALNRRHTDAAQMPGERLTIEAPTKCIASDMDRVDWKLREQPLMSLSPSTILFFQSAPRADVLPGKPNAPFYANRISPADCRDARATIVQDPTTSRWRFAMRRLAGLLSFPVAEAASNPQLKPPDVDLKIQALTSAYPLGYPVAVRVMAINTGERTLPLVGRLLPAFGMVQIETRRPAAGDDWAAVKPIAWYEPMDDDEAMLAPGARTEQTVPIYFQSDDWTFPVAGSYEVRARLHLGEDTEEVVTDPIRIVIENPQAPRDRQALQLLTDDDGRLRRDLGRMLLLGGRVQEGDAAEKLESITREFPETALGSALQLTRASQLLRRLIDPATGTRPAPDVAGARELLADSCTDSGVAALRLQLLNFQEDATGAQPAPTLLEPVESAWEGSVPRRAVPMATYSDATLSVMNQSFHFCVNESRLRKAPANAARRFASELRRAKPERVVIVGHADRDGTCRYNDGLAMRRAEAMRAVLIEAGIHRNRIQIASLGKRRPLDFSSTDATDALNRRVEVLVPAAVAAKFKQPEKPSQRYVQPRCEAALQGAQRAVSADEGREVDETG